MIQIDQLEDFILQPYKGNPSSFCSGYFCKDFLTRDLEFCHLPHCNSGKDFIPSRMLGGY